MRSLLSWLVTTILVIAILFGVLGIRTVDQSEVCVKTVLGEVRGVPETGFHVVNFLTTKYSCYPTAATMFQTGENENKDADYWDYSVEIKTSDGQTGRVSFNVLFSTDRNKALEIRSTVAKNTDDLVERVVGNYARSVPRDVAALFDADGLYATKRTEYATQVETLLGEDYTLHGVNLISFELRDVQFNEAYEKSIEDQQIAQEQVKTSEYQAEQKEWDAIGLSNIALGEANAEIERAKGYAESTVLKATADAEALRLVAQALRSNPDLLRYEAIQKLNPMVEIMYLPTDSSLILNLPNNNK